jgi:hypothetical protein
LNSEFLPLPEIMTLLWAAVWVASIMVGIPLFTRKFLEENFSVKMPLSKMPATLTLAYALPAMILLWGQR